MNGWKKKILANEFLSESCCFLDTDKKIEVLAGEYVWSLDKNLQIEDRKKVRQIDNVWLPSWPYPERLDPHADLRKESNTPPQYKNDMYDFYIKIGNKKVVITVGMHKEPIRLYDNLTGNAIWNCCEIIQGGIYESVCCADLFQLDQNVIITIPQKGCVAWYSPFDDYHIYWKEHIVGNLGGDWHGLGVGDINNDGRNEIITSQGFYEQYDNEAWKWIPIYSLENGKLTRGLGDVFRIEVVENNSCGSMPLLFSTSPHNYGFWYWELIKADSQKYIYKKNRIDSSHSQLHNLRVIAIDQRKYIITGKRKYAHGKYGDVGSDESSVLMACIYENGKIYKEIIDKDSGAGLYFDVMKKNGKLYVATSNKNGVFLYEK